MKVSIVGAGLGGLLAATVMHRQGWDVTTFAWGGVKTKGFLTLWPNALWVLDRLGLLEQTLAAGKVKKSSEIKNLSGAILAQVPLGAMEHATGYPVLNIARNRLVELLQNECSGMDIVNKKFLSYKQNNSEDRYKRRNVTLYFDDGTSTTTNLLIGADGFFSGVRQQMVGAENSRYAGRFSFNGVAENCPSFVLEELPGEMFYEIQGRGKRVGFARIDGNRVGWYANLNRPETFSIPENKIEFLSNQYNVWPKLITTLFQSTENTDVECYKIQDKNPIATWVDEHVALLGDAAHPMTPDAGQGVCQAMEDAWVLGSELTLAMEKNQPVGDALKIYEKKRTERTRKVVLYARKLGHISNWSSAPACILRETLLRMVPDKKMIQPFIKLVRAPEML